MFARPFTPSVPLAPSALCFAALILGLGLFAASRSGELPQLGGNPAADGTGVIQGYGELPLAFEENRGQTAGRVDFLARASGQTAFLTSAGATLSLQPDGRRAEGAAVRLDLIGADPAARPIGLDRLPGDINVLRGDPQGSTTAIATFERVRYADVYPGIDVAWYGAQGGQLEYDFVVSPGADPKEIGVEFEGARQVSLTDSGAIRIQTAAGTLLQRPPVAYQQIDGKRAPVASRYELSGGRAHVAVGGYDPERPLVIDPVLVYSTVVGGSLSDSANAIAVDAAGNAYVTGFSVSSNFPTTPGAVDTTGGGTSTDAFVAKLNPAGSALDYATFLGSSSQGEGIAVDATGSVYLTGQAQAPSFPTTAGAFDTSFNGGQDVYVAKLNPSGSSLDYSTFLGGNSADIGLAITFDASGSAYVTGLAFSPGYPTTPGALDTTKNGPGPGGPSGDARDAIVTKLNPAGSGLDYSTFLGGQLGDDGFGIQVDSTGSAYVVGGTASSAFPATAGALDPMLDGPSDGFAAKLNSTGSALDYSTFVGGAGADSLNGLDLDAYGNAYLAGRSNSTDLPTTPGAFDTSHNGADDGFVAKLDGSGSSLAYSTFLGGATGLDSANAIAVDGSGNASVTGETQSTDFPTSPDAFDSDYNGGIRDTFVAQLDGAGADLAYSTFMGSAAVDQGQGIALDGDGNAYVTGRTDAADFPTTAGAFDETYNGIGGSSDVFVAMFGTAAPNPDTDGDGIVDSVDPDPGTPSGAFDDGDGNTGSIADANGLAVSVLDATVPDGVRVIVGPGVGKATLSVCGGFTLKVSAGSDVTVTCGSVTVEVAAGDAEIVLGDGSTTVLVPAGVTATVSENPDGSFEVANHGGGDITVTVDGVETTLGPGETTEVRTWHFVGFSPPVDNPPVLNVADAGQAIPLKWRLVDTSGAPVTNLTTAHMTATSLACSLGSSADLLEESAPGNSGLQNLGNGYYQFNWKTPKSYAKSCKTLHLDLGEGITRDAYFQFKK